MEIFLRNRAKAISYLLYKYKQSFVRKQLWSVYFHHFQGTTDVSNDHNLNPVPFGHISMSLFAFTGVENGVDCAPGLNTVFEVPIYLTIKCHYNKTVKITTVLPVYYQQMHD